MADKILRYLAIANFVDSCIVVLLQVCHNKLYCSLK